MKLGAERKKLFVLAALLVVAGIVYWINSASDAPPPSTTGAHPAANITAPTQTEAVRAATRRKPTGGPDGVGEKTFEAPLTVDPVKTDPTLRLDLLAKLQDLKEEGGVRNIFKREAAPPEPTVVADAGKKVPKVPNVDVHQPQPPSEKEKASTGQPPPPPVPTAAPITLKYYGYSKKRSDGEKKAFFLDGDDVIVAAEGEIIKKQYKVLRIGDTAVQMEDTTSKSTQSLPIQELPAV
jgi:hypothetical protein